MDLVIRITNGPGDCFGWGKLGILVVVMSDAVSGEATSKFSGGVSSHAVGHHEHMSATFPGVFISGELYDVGILVI